MREALTWIVLALAAAGAGWTWTARASTKVGPHLCDVHAGEAAAAASPMPAATFEVAEQRPARASPELRKAARLAAAYVPGAADEEELERFWRACGPIPPDDLVPLLQELEQRVASFERIQVELAARGWTRPPSGQRWTSNDFFAEYSKVALAEARFLAEECIAGRMREAPFVPVPSTVLETSHPTTRIVSHPSATGARGFVARLDQDLAPQLFAERVQIESLAKEVAANEALGDTSASRPPKTAERDD